MGATSVVTKLSGTLAGLGHTVSNLTLNAPTKNFVALIGQTSGTTAIRDIGLVDVDVTGNRRVAALIGWANGANTISGVYSTGAVFGYQGETGGLIGRSFGGITTITDSYSSVNVTAPGGVGGLVGMGYKTRITNCHATGKVTATNDISGNMGGLAGYLQSGIVVNSYARGTVGNETLTGEFVGGLIGQSFQTTVENSFATGDVNGGGNVGGLIGEVLLGEGKKGGSVDNCWASGNVTAAGGGVGGLVGSGRVLFSNPDGRLYLTRSFATGDVRTTSTGGVWYLGGLAGSWDGDVTHSFATGNVIGNGRDGHGGGATAHMGGLVGALRTSKGSISDSYATGDVTGGFSYVGGLVGNGSNITRSWASGRVSVTPRGSCFGGLVGQGMNVSDSYWNADTTGQSSAIGHTAAGYVPTNTKGLTNVQWKDLPYYRNGTINQVLADRATAAAARQTAAKASAEALQKTYEANARGEAGHATGRSLQQDADPSRETGTAGMLADGDRSFTPLNKHIVLHDSYDHSVYMKTIGAKGAHFGLEGSSSGKKKKR